MILRARHLGAVEHPVNAACAMRHPDRQPGVEEPDGRRPAPAAELERADAEQRRGEERAGEVVDAGRTPASQPCAAPRPWRRPPLRTRAVRPPTQAPLRRSRPASRSEISAAPKERSTSTGDSLLTRSRRCRGHGSVGRWSSALCRRATTVVTRLRGEAIPLHAGADSRSAARSSRPGPSRSSITAASISARSTRARSSG